MPVKRVVARRVEEGIEKAILDFLEEDWSKSSSSHEIVEVLAEKGVLPSEVLIGNRLIAVERGLGRLLTKGKVKRYDYWGAYYYAIAIEML